MFYIDVGAHTGVYTQQYCQNGIVFAFEPNPVNQEILYQRFGRNPNVHIMPYAVGLTTGIVKLYRFPEDKDCHPNNTGRSSILSENKNVNANIFYEVQMITLSDFIIENGICKINTVKIDTEGAEYDILTDLMNKHIINRINTIVLSEHKFLFGHTFRAKADAVMERLRKTFNGKIVEDA